ncbi:cytochrome b561 domain-containing protein 2-like [Anoplophora glabripennis]|uniref:cytochrome b561 domain-containing protein 2-like n=1 Tax=Anoplophora glabripennis TaxID=217634 RepID=UPI000C7712D2|nr:cytochrome b561 domain-containing protein 2-like [Anoplophora glabripennis]
MPLTAEALMLFAGDELWSRQLSRTEKYGVHGVLATIGILCLIVGNLPGIYYIKPGFPLYTVHGITGLVSMVILTLSIFLGLSVNYSQEMKNFCSLKPVCYKLIHNMTGLTGYAVGIASLCYAYFTDWFILYNGDISRMTALIVTILASLWSVNKALVSLYGQIKSVIF